MRRRLAAPRRALGGIMLVGAAGAATACAADRGSGPGHAGHPPAVPRARLRRQRPRVAGARRAERVVVRENGLRVKRRARRPARGSGLRFGVVLALDASESMTGRPAAPPRSMRPRVRQPSDARRRRSGSSPSTVSISVLQRPDPGRRGAPPGGRTSRRSSRYGTRIHDAITRRSRCCATRLSAGSIVLLSDGADIGSVRPLDDVIAAASEQQVRDLHRRAPLGRVRPSHAAEIADDRRRLRGGAVAPSWRADLRGARRRSSRASTSSATAPTRARCRRSTSASTSRARGGVDGVRRADAVASGSVSPLPDLDVPALADLAARARPLRRVARVHVPAPHLAAAASTHRRPRPELRERFAGRPHRSAATVALRAATRNRYATRLVGAARARPRARADDGDAAPARRHLAGGHVRDLPRSR